MNKFKVGDKVVRTGLSVGKALQGGVYEISEVFPLISNRLGINLEGHETDGIARFQYYSSGFELYDDNILSPLEAAEAMLKDKDIEFLSEVNGEWRSVGRPYSQQCLKTLSEYKLRHKPKTVIINGVEVVAPANKDDIEQYFYTVNFSENIVHTIDKVYIDRGFKYYWAKKEDAQKALDAMLIPFEQ